MTRLALFDHFRFVRSCAPARIAAATAALLAGAPLSLRAQGTLSDQGFGYPPGQLSTRALGSAGALGETDAASPINPASLASWGRGGIFFQFAPEFTEISSGGQSDRTTSTRFPLVAAAMRVRSNVTAGISSSTFLERNFTTSSTVEQTLPGGGRINTTTTLASSGAANDVRLGAAWSPRRTISVGLAAHAFTGRNRVSVSATIADPDDTSTTNPFSPLNETRTLSFSGIGVSGGVQVRPVRGLLVALSGRHGGTLRLSAGDTLISRARVPDRAGAALLFEGIPGALLTARVNWEQWSSLEGLGSSATRAFDATEYSAGADVAGPRVGSRVLLLRLGARSRTLPFAAVGAKVRETAYAGGFGIPLAGDRTVIDFAAQRATRSASGTNASERAWTLGFGLTVRP